MSEGLKILFATSELAPLLSTGGLADVARALPRALHAQGHDVRVAMPCYRSIDPSYRGTQQGLCEADLGAGKEYGALRESRMPGTDIPLYLIEHDRYFGRETPYGTGAYEYDDNAERFCFFSQALLDAVPRTGWVPDLIHCHDWHTAAILVFARTRFKDDPVWGEMPTLFTIHNLAFQGRYPAEHMARTGLEAWLYHPDFLEYEGDMNLMKAAIAFATKINTVSPRYAREIQTLDYGTGLDGILRTRSTDLCGVLNGVEYEVWNPAADPHIAENFSRKKMAGKAACKVALQQHCGLPVCDAPLIGVVSRLYWQKGIDLLVDAIDRIADMDVQIAVLGTGDPDLEKALRGAVARHPKKVSATIDFDVPFSHQVFAGSDFFFMPSRYEPCGLSQMYAMAYGTVPIVRRTGGLADTVRNVDAVHRRHGDATGIVFLPASSTAAVRAVARAIDLYDSPKLMRQVRVNGMTEDFSWERASHAYVELYRSAIAALRVAEAVPVGGSRERNENEPL